MKGVLPANTSILTRARQSNTTQVVGGHIMHELCRMDWSLEVSAREQQMCLPGPPNPQPGGTSAQSHGGRLGGTGIRLQ